MICVSFYICSHVKLLALTKAVEKVTTKSQSKESDVKIVEEENEEHGEEEEKTVVCKTHGQKVGSAGGRSRGRGRKTQPKRQTTKSKAEVEDVKVDVKDISVKGVGVMIKGLSLEELSPVKDNTDVVEIKYKTPKIHKQTARKGIPLHGRKRNVDRKTLSELKKTENIEEPDDLGRSVKLKDDYEVDVSKSSHEEWLKDQKWLQLAVQKKI